MGFEGDNGSWECYMRYKELQQRVIFYSVCPINATEKSLDQVTEFVIRVNDGLIIGNFELHLESGLIRFKTSVDVDGVNKDFKNILRNLAYANVMIMDLYMPGIMLVISRAASAKEAIEKIEGEKEAQRNKGKSSGTVSKAVF
ncbi:MAG: YbjN domain-containing protein [Candidatus Dojkabacteria bacterium]